ncbi:MAG: sugar phosphate nucleotidyltransferase [Candidatus Marsarchaeota archaeon]|jgi:NDP-sugar pyrophosphorylase family protein|nr:sugar phosphate nucleotidyltransferase [Candidatus Marsarchaeota archaeon]MCL5418581.1 sugar phosphate nucleotidyltransferase [Candidatus Marsarchaeota archaeon]
MKERLTITLDKDLLQSLDATIDGVTIRNRSHAIERLLDMALMHSNPRKAVLLAGGPPVSFNGKQMPKPMVPINGRPIIDYVVRELERNRITDIIIVSSETDMISEYFAKEGRRRAKINYVVEDSRKGTEGALYIAKGMIGRDPFFAMNADCIFRINLEDVYKQHVVTNAVATMVVATQERTENFGLAKVTGLKITSFVEKPQVEFTDLKLINAGIYLFNPTILSKIKIGPKPLMLETDLFPKLAKEGQLYSFIFSGLWAKLNMLNLESSLAKLSNVSTELKKD